MAIELRKTGDKHRINLEKTKALPGEIKINLDWSKGGFLKKIIGGAIDLDLGCFYELKDGKKDAHRRASVLSWSWRSQRSGNTSGVLYPEAFYMAYG